MTPQPQQEYIITEEQLLIVSRSMEAYKVCMTLAEIRSHPTPTPHDQPNTIEQFPESP